MFRTTVRLLVLSGLLGVLPGCALLEPAKRFTHQTKRIFTPNPNDYRDTTSENVDQWSYVGKEARGDQPMEKDPDPWFREHLMSSKARRIERNLGIE